MLYSTSHSVVKKKMHTPVEIFSRVPLHAIPKSAIYHDRVPFREWIKPDLPIRPIDYLDSANNAACSSIFGSLRLRIFRCGRVQGATGRNPLRSIAIQKNKKGSLGPLCEAFSFTEGLPYAI